ncbi:tRNA (guanosine(37)-N1)-methyltransferase TrmD [bacterium]|nr:tRNA (guanosine(37)-N1)-methyltransferase TrmD [bacterium]MBU1675605.1 tRNA (guanosine(37)-N1)-methyltransferase TrmD [bacterium]
MAIKVLTLFPDMVRSVLGASILGRAAAQGQVTYTVADIRDHAVDRHGTVDDYPYGGGPGMIMMAPPVIETVEAVREDEAAPLVLMTPQGETLDEALVLELLVAARAAGELILICGHYKGVDQRVADILRPREVSIGDYVLTGGELPALVLIDALVRRLPGVLGNSDSADADSFTTAQAGGLDGCWYTRPAEFRGHAVPDILLSGHHAKIAAWREAEARDRTRARRPDLIDDENGPTADGGESER